MESDIKAQLLETLQKKVVERRAMFIPLICVSTFGLVGYAAIDKEAPVIESNKVAVKNDTQSLDSEEKQSVAYVGNSESKMNYNPGKNVICDTIEEAFSKVNNSDAAVYFTDFYSAKCIWKRLISNPIHFLPLNFFVFILANIISHREILKKQGQLLGGILNETDAD